MRKWYLEISALLDGVPECGHGPCSLLIGVSGLQKFMSFSRSTQAPFVNPLLDVSADAIRIYFEWAVELSTSRK